MLKSGADIVVFARFIKLVFGERAQRDNFAVLRAHFLDHFRHQLFSYALPFQAGIDVRVLDNAQMLPVGTNTISAT